MTTAPVRVLVADDSTTSRAWVVAILQRDPGIEVVGEATDGLEALELTKRLQPSVVVMDIDMPRMSGVEATKRIMVDQPTPIVMITASSDAHHVEVGLRAVRAGAMTVAPKPGGPNTAGASEQAERLVMLVKAMADTKVIRHRSLRDRDVAPPPETGADRTGPKRIEAVAVAASTGGPSALFRFLESLPRTLDIPVLVVQHIAAGFVDGLALWLSSATVLPVCLAEDRMAIAGGQVYLAPDDRHLEVADGQIRLSDAAPIGGFRPSANALISSVADAYGSRGAAAVLTGMGRDGVDGARRLRDAGGFVFAQDEATSVVYGMPQAVATAGLADFIGSVEEICLRIVDRAPTRKL